MVIVTAWEPQHPGQTGVRLPAHGSPGLGLTGHPPGMGPRLARVRKHTQPCVNVGSQEGSPRGWAVSALGPEDPAERLAGRPRPCWGKGAPSLQPFWCAECDGGISVACPWSARDPPPGARRPLPALPRLSAASADLRSSPGPCPDCRAHPGLTGHGSVPAGGEEGAGRRRPTASGANRGA